MKLQFPVTPEFVDALQGLFENNPHASVEQIISVAGPEAESWNHFLRDDLKMDEAARLRYILSGLTQYLRLARDRFSEGRFNAVVELKTSEIQPTYNATHIVALCGNDLFVIKSRGVHPLDASMYTPTRPDRVIGIFNDGTTREMELREEPYKPVRDVATVDAEGEDPHSARASQMFPEFDDPATTPERRRELRTLAKKYDLSLMGSGSLPSAVILDAEGGIASVVSLGLVDDLSAKETHLPQGDGLPYAVASQEAVEAAVKVASDAKPASVVMHKDSKINPLDLPPGTTITFEGINPMPHIDRAPVGADFDISSVPLFDRDLVRRESDIHVGPATMTPWRGKTASQQPDFDASTLDETVRPYFEGYQPNRMMFEKASDVKRYEASYADAEVREAVETLFESSDIEEFGEALGAAGGDGEIRITSTRSFSLPSKCLGEAAPKKDF